MSRARGRWRFTAPLLCVSLMNWACAVAQPNESATPSEKRNARASAPPAVIIRRDVSGWVQKQPPGRLVSDPRLPEIVAREVFAISDPQGRYERKGWLPRAAWGWRVADAPSAFEQTLVFGVKWENQGQSSVGGAFVVVVVDCKAAACVSKFRRQFRVPGADAGTFSVTFGPPKDLDGDKVPDLALRVSEDWDDQTDHAAIEVLSASGLVKESSF